MLSRGGLHSGGTQRGRGEEGSSGGEGKCRDLESGSKSFVDDGVDGPDEYSLP